MAARKKAPTEFGIEVMVYCARRGITRQKLAEQAGVSYDTLRDAVRGKRPGYEVVEKVRAIMEEVQVHGTAG